MIETYPDFPGWSFDVGEYSIGVYEVTATNAEGKTFKCHGPISDDAIELCKRMIRNSK